MCLFQKALLSQSRAPSWLTALWLVQTDSVPNTRSRLSAEFTVKTVSLSPLTAPPLNTPPLSPRHVRDFQSMKNWKLPPSTAETAAARAGQVRTLGRKVIDWCLLLNKHRSLVEICRRSDWCETTSPVLFQSRQTRFYSVFWPNT